MNRDSLIYINWLTDATLYRVTTSEFADIYDRLKKEGIEKNGAKTIKREWFEAAGEDGTAYQLERRKNYLRLLTFSFDEGYRIYSTNTFDESKNDTKGFEYKPTVAFAKFREEFAKLHGSKDPKFFGRVFGTTPDAFLKNIMRPLYYFNPFYEGKKIKCGSIDRSSAYPADACGALPNANTAVIREGYVEPTEEYPFAFYMKSGHVAEYGRYNSREWISLPFEPNFFQLRDGRPNFSYMESKDEEETVLMKPAIYTLDEVWEKFYQKKEKARSMNEKKLAKAIMVSTIGCWHMTNTMRYYPYHYAHLAAIVIARANWRCIEKMREIGFLRCVHVVVDGIAYAGTDNQGTEEKKLGGWINEAVGCEGYFKGTNLYIIKKGEEVVKERHSGFNFFKDDTPIREKSITRFEDLDNLKRM